MSWTNINEKRIYRSTLVGTEKEWKVKLNEIQKRKHVVLKQGESAYAGDFMFGRDNIKRFWADVQIPEGS